MAEPIVISRLVNAKRKRIFKALINPADIMKYNYADVGWTTPHAETDPQVDGKFKIGFSSPDGKIQFDVVGTYTEVDEPKKLSQKLGDGRNVEYTLEKEHDDHTRVTIKFDPENINSRDKQALGWTAILEHLAEYVETLPDKDD
jgi:uncharacterized protein YndB with AHSA1/START domain